MSLPYGSLSVSNLWHDLWEVVCVLLRPFQRIVIGSLGHQSAKYTVAV